MLIVLIFLNFYQWTADVHKHILNLFQLSDSMLNVLLALSHTFSQKTISSWPLQRELKVVPFAVSIIWMCSPGPYQQCSLGCLFKEVFVVLGVYSTLIKYKKHQTCKT